MKKKVVFQGSNKQKLTEAEQAVLILLTDEFLTTKKIAIRRKCSKQAVSKIIRNLKKKGAINKALKKVVFSQGTRQPRQPNREIRLHGQEFNIRILYKDLRYRDLLKKANFINIDGNSIRLYQGSIEVYINKSFEASTPQKATAASFTYFNRLLARLEHDLKVILIKPRSHNIKLVKAHYAETNNELAGGLIDTGEKIKVYATDDGQLWFTIDNSFNLREAETQHSKTAKQDMEEVVQPFFNDLRDNPLPLLSDLMRYLSEQAEANKETASGLAAVMLVLKSQMPKKTGPSDVTYTTPEYVG
jgi:DNA-binding CsgD family transcriptional regulator